MLALTLLRTLTRTGKYEDCVLLGTNEFYSHAAGSNVSSLLCTE